MTNTYKPHLDEQPKSNEDLKRQQALEADREKPSIEDWELEDDLLNAETPMKRDAHRTDGQSQKQAQQSQSQQ